MGITNCSRIRRPHTSTKMTLCGSPGKFTSPKKRLLQLQDLECWEAELVRFMLKPLGGNFLLRAGPPCRALESYLQADQRFSRETL